MAADPDAILAELDGLVGLEAVKAAIRRIADVHRLNARRAAAGEPVLPQPLDLVFAGEPGTGEDEVAAIVGRLYVALGLLPSGQVVEVSRAQLVGSAPEETLARVGAAIEAARGGILFVDEAHLLVPMAPDDPAAAALPAIVAAMASQPGAFAVILAGPTEPMRILVEHHPALRTAFDDLIEFPRYTPDELVRIFEAEAAGLRIEVPPDVRAAVADHLAAVHEGGRFRSTRYVPGLVEEMYARMASRVAADGAADDAHRSFAVGDVPAPAQASLGDTGIRVGFTGDLDDD